MSATLQANPLKKNATVQKIVRRRFFYGRLCLPLFVGEDYVTFGETFYKRCRECVEILLLNIEVAAAKEFEAVV
jgi:hypothetical protein